MRALEIRHEFAQQRAQRAAAEDFEWFRRRHELANLMLWHFLGAAQHGAKARWCAAEPGSCHTQRLRRSRIGGARFTLRRVRETQKEKERAADLAALRFVFVGGSLRRW
jgi:hypothetical protein